MNAVYAVLTVLLIAVMEYGCMVAVSDEQAIREFNQEVHRRD